MMPCLTHFPSSRLELITLLFCAQLCWVQISVLKLTEVAFLSLQIVFFTSLLTEGKNLSCYNVCTLSIWYVSQRIQSIPLWKKE